MIFNPPPSNRGAANATCCIKTPATAEAAAHAPFLTRLVTPAANVRSSGCTTAATYDCRVGTSISTSDSRSRNNTIAHRGEGMNAAAIRNMLEGRWVKTMVLISPIRRASHAAPRCESAFNTWTVKNNRASWLSAMPKRRKNQYETSASVRKPPPKASIANNAESCLMVDLVSGETATRGASAAPALLISTSDDNNRYKSAVSKLIAAYAIKRYR